MGVSVCAGDAGRPREAGGPGCTRDGLQPPREGAAECLSLAVRSLFSHQQGAHQQGALASLLLRAFFDQQVFEFNARG